MGTSLSERWPEASAGGERWTPETEADREAIRAQLDRLFGSPLFSSSKRYPNLLKYIVEETVAGRAGNLKERTLGIKVFGRDPTYDTSQDPVVRTSAAKVRDRISQYYLEAGHESEIRIDLLPGSYVPQFRRVAECPEGDPAPVPEAPPVVADPHRPAPEIASPEQAADAPEPETPPTVTAPRQSRSRRYILAAGVVSLAVAGWVVPRYWGAREPEAAFWGPVWDKSNAFVICVPGRFPTAETAAQTAGNATPPEPLSIMESLRLNRIAWPDATTLYALVGYIQSHHQAYHVRRAGDSALSDLRTGPAILIGGLNNEWLMRLTSRYRFTYQDDRGAGEAWIEDAQKPGQREWKVTYHAPYSTFDEDYGIVSRVWDPTTEHLVVTASGIASYGTIAAGEFLVSPRQLAMIAERAPSGWEKKSVQVVFATKVFNGNAGPPRILAIHVW